MASGELQGWHPDPFGLHEVRYFSAGRPTKLVRDGRVDTYDEPPEDGVVATAAASAVDGHASAASAIQTAGAAAGPAATSVFAAAQGPGQLPSASTAPRQPEVQRRRRGEYIAVALGAVVAVVVFVVLGGRGGGSGKPGLAPAAFVTKAAKRTLAQSTADVTMSGTVQVAGQTVSIGGNGLVDFTTGVFSLNVGATMSNGSITETELLVGGNLYLQVNLDGHSVAAATGGKHWVQIPFAQLGTRSQTTSSPASSLALLSQAGARVTALQPRVIGGQTCDGYTVTPSKQAMLTAAKQQYLKLGLSDTQATAALEVLQNAPPPTITAWFGDHSQLACQMSVSMPIGQPNSAGSNEAQVVMSFTHYGVPVKVTAPAASDTVALGQLLKATHS